MLFRVITSEGDVMLHSMFAYGIGLNTETYVRFYEEAIPWVERGTAGRT